MSAFVGQPLRRSLAVQFRIVHALAMREALTRYGRHNIGFLWLFAEPMVFTLGITTFWTLTKVIHGSDLPIVPFAITGYSSVLLWRNMPGRLMHAIGPNSGLLHHRNVRLFDIYCARLLLESSGVTMSFLFLSLFFCWGLEWMEPPEDMFSILMGWFLLNWFGWALGITVGSLSERTEVLEKLWHPATYFLFPLSGAAFIVDVLPPAARDLILYLPMVHCVEYIRMGFFGSSFTPHYDLSYVVAVSAVLTIFGLLNMFHVSRRIVLE